MKNKTVQTYDEVLKHHRQSLAALEEKLQSLGIEQVAKENEELKDMKEELDEKFKSLSKEYNELKKDYTDLKVGFMSHLASEKMVHITHSKSRMDLLFKQAEDRVYNHLEKITIEMESHIDAYTQKAEILTESLKEKYQNELNAIKDHLKPDVLAARAELDRLLQLEKASMEAYDNQELQAVTEAMLIKESKPSVLEFKWGLSIVNKIGALLIVLAVVLAGQYTYSNFFNDIAKGITFYSIGIVMIVIGELFSRKKYKALSMSLLGGGIGILYASTFISTFYLNILDLWPALGIAVVIAICSIVLSWQHKSQTLAAISLIGGYLPVFAYVVVEGIDTLPVLGAVTYLMVLNFVILAMSLRHDWKLSIIIGFAFNLICVDALVMLMDAVYLQLAVLAINFLTYFEVITYRMLNKTIRIAVEDTLITLFNTIGHISMIYLVLNIDKEFAYNGVIAIIFGTLYLAIGIVAQKRRIEPKQLELYYLISAVFGVLVVPLQLELEWWFIAWLLQSVAFLAVGRRNGIASIQVGGIVLLIISHYMFYLDNFDVLMPLSDFTWSGDLNYLALILGELSVFYLYRDESKLNSAFSSINRFFRYFVLAHIIYFVTIELMKTVNSLSGDLYMVESVVLFMTSGILMVKMLKYFDLDKYIHMDMFKKAAYSLIAITALISNFEPAMPVGIRWSIDILALILLNYFIIRVMVMWFKDDRIGTRIPTGVSSVVIGLYCLFAYYVNFAQRIDTNYDDVLLNLSLILFAIAYVLLGFLKYNSSLRKVGLLLALVTTAKLLLWDSMHFELGQRIVSYFAFGIILIAMSYVYQRINAKLEEQLDGGDVDDKEN
ncbi:MULTISPECIES: DUF2339 domain-containing protein [unclassified Fusibacter]|uniref:DUF2339 domain-containing protein n=1 Tax=unclassified Fusibacter TaxID=2624464 RepID=UPI00101134CD|nr:MULTISPECIES: DUF2339 domain-containing protein [unclassified Fusibacter]MCK8058963.1 DUF2339 domain-containing protein [Fusibacter sp. A2]NPE22040.1 DUF2339 domain-containing protein [Fusibacter sp. A1]RXV61604.1 DUF2339 domain-containing protein [Fusibacter sp. A1]